MRRVGSKASMRDFSAWFSAFDTHVARAVEIWAKEPASLLATPTFVALELGCGSGKGGLPMLEIIKRRVAEKNAEARVIIFQVDNAFDSVTKEWETELAEGVFLKQSMYDPIELGANKANLIYSQAALHWLDEFFPMHSNFRAQDSSEVSARGFAKLMNNLESVAAPHHVLSVMAMGMLDHEHFLPALEKVSRRFMAAFNACPLLSQSESELMQWTLQVPLQTRIVRRQLEALGYTMSAPVALPPMAPLSITTPQVAKAIADPTFLTFPLFRERFKSVFPDRAHEVEKVLQSVADVDAQLLLKNGTDDPLGMTLGGAIWFMAEK